MEPGAPGASAQSNIPVIHLQQSASQSQLDDKDEWQQQEEQQKQQFMHGGHQHQWDDHSGKHEQFEQSQPKHPEQCQQHVDEQKSSAESNSPVLHLQQFTSQLQGDNQRNQLKDNNNEQQQQGEQKQQLMKGELQQQQNQQGNHSNQHELFQQSQPQHPEQGQPHVDDQSEHLWLETLQVQQEQYKEEQEQHQHQDKQLHMQQALQTHQQLQQLQIQPQVQQLQQQQFNHRQSLRAVTSEQNTSRSITFSYLVEMILPHLPREQAEWARATLLRFKRKEITRNDFVSSTRKVVGDRILVQTVKQIQKKQQAESQSVSSSQPNQLQQKQQQKQKQHTQGSSKKFLPKQSLHTQQLNEQNPFQHVSLGNIQQQTQKISDCQPLFQIRGPKSLIIPHSPSDNKLQESNQVGEQFPEISSLHLSQTSTMHLHQVKHEADGTIIGFPPSNQPQKPHLEDPQLPSTYGCTPETCLSQSCSLSPNEVKAPAQDSQIRRLVHPQVGVQTHKESTQLSNIKTMPTCDLLKSSKNQEDKERQKIVQSVGISYFSDQHQPSAWETASDKEHAGNTGILPSPVVCIKQDVNENSDLKHNLQTLKPVSDNLSTRDCGSFDQGQSSVQPKAEDVEHQSIMMSSISSGDISTANSPLEFTGIQSKHVMQAPLATSSTATLHHTLSAFGGPISGGHTSGNLLQGQMCIQMASAPPSSAVGSQMNTPPKIALFGQKECYEATIPSKQLPRKKQKVSGDYLDQRIDQLNDVTAVSGVNLREEEEKLFAGPKDESCVAEAIRNVVQEEERFFLEKGPLHAKLAAIMAKYSIKYISTDSERCLSLCVEEHLRTMIGQLIRLSKQRVDLERVGHKVALTSDVRCQILALNKKVKEDLEKKQAEEAEKLRKLYGTSTTENNASTEAEKDESNVKIKRAHKESDKMRANAANVAARAAIGGDDMLLKWQRMAEQAQQKHKGTLYQTSNTCTNRDVSRKNMAGRLEAGNVSDHLDAPSTGIVQNLGREYPSSECTQTEAVHAICVKDVIALLEQEPHMTKSTLLYLLYERHAE